MKKTITSIVLYLLWYTSLMMSFVEGQSCPGETPLKGSAELSQGEVQELGYIIDKENTRLAAIEYCISTGSDGDQHFRGFKATFTSDNSSALAYQFGGSGDPSVDDCEVYSFASGTFTNGLIVYSDQDDLEGFKLLDQTGKFWEMKTSSGGE